jgi:hypothetical protein
MIDLIVFIKSSGPNVREDNLTDTITSFAKKNLKSNYKFYIVCDPGIELWVDKIFKNSAHRDFLKEEHLLDLKISTNSWANDFNEFFEKSQNLSKWVLISHDDVQYITDNYFQKMVESVHGHEEEVGWLTSTSNYYTEVEGRVVTDIFRPGAYKDYNNWGAMFYLHKMAHLKNASSGVVKRNLHLYDYPVDKKAVKIHGIMSAVMMIKSNTLKKVGLCEDWTQYTMLIDEDWSLEALRNNLWNIWVPDVFHSHPLRRGLRPTNNKWENEAHAGFARKWGFITGDRPRGISISVEELRQEFSDNNIPWSSYRNSYEWEYLDVK